MGIGEGCLCFHGVCFFLLLFGIVIPSPFFTDEGQVELISLYMLPQTSHAYNLVLYCLNLVHLPLYVVRLASAIYLVD